MKIYTKTGDKGSTMLLGGLRVAKHHIKIESYGEVDMLNVQVGLLLDVAPKTEQSPLLESFQNQLFTIGSHLSLVEGNTSVSLPEISSDWLIAMEQAIDAMDAQLPELKNFVLPGGSIAASQAHVARCQCRKAERNVSRLSEIESIQPLILPYLNRLSDYFFELSRYYLLVEKKAERPWLPKKD